MKYIYNKTKQKPILFLFTFFIMKKIFFISISILFILVIYWYNTFADKWESSPYSLKSWFKLYKERVKNICNEYKEKKQVVKLEENYLFLEKGPLDLDKLKETHRENMNSIYKCWILSVQEKSLLLIKEELIKKNPNLIKALVEKINAKLEIIKLSLSKFECIKSKEKSSVLKLHVLKQATYQTCKYINYLEYAKEHNNYVYNVWSFTWDSNSISNLIYKQEEMKSEINDEITHTYKVFPYAYDAYTEYENNITIHFLLELIKEDYIVLREKLNKVLNPINQVVYKISNAMRK